MRISNNPWKDVVIDALICDWALTGDNQNDPEKALSDLIRIEVMMALDPSISKEAQALYQKGFDDAMQQKASG